MYDVTIIGSGCAGYAAAMYSSRLNLKTLLIGDLDGGTIMNTDIVENYPGFIRLTGEELANNLKKHAMQYPSLKMVSDLVIEIKKEKECFKAYTKTKLYNSKTIIFAAGTNRRMLNVPGENEFKGRGVHSCALCDGPFYKGKIVAVVGGSDSAAKEALVLSTYAKKVFIIYRGEQIRPEPINLQRVQKTKNIEIISKTNVLKINGNKKVHSVSIDKKYKGKNELALDAIFIEVGHIPNSKIAKNLGVKINDKSEIIIGRESQTNLPGFFAAGDVVDTKFKQAITGVGEAVTASYSAYQYVNHISIMPCGDEEDIN